MLISTVKMRSPTRSKLYQGKEFLMHTQPCGEYLSFPTAPVSISKAVCQNLSCGAAKADHCIGPGDTEPFK